jgi:hypothetical protein
MGAVRRIRDVNAHVSPPAAAALKGWHATRALRDQSIDHLSKFRRGL